MRARSRINDTVERLLPREAKSLVSGARRGSSQLFRRRGMSDPLWGFIELLPHEAALMVTPLMRRLQGIRQTAFAYFAHPGATHDRYSHSLGVMHQATEIWRNLKRYHPELAQDDAYDLCLLRLAALLHDVGHGPYSHSSEGLFREFPDMKELQEELALELEIPVSKIGASEAISATVVTSPAFRSFLKTCASDSEYPLSEIPCEEIARFFFGWNTHKKYPWLSRIISGSIDADKLDYLHRDGEFAGLETTVDLTRLYSNLRISNNRMIVLRDGLSSIADLAENRFSLTNLMYSEPLGRIADAMFRRALEVDSRRPDTKLDSCAAFYEFEDATMLSYLRSSPVPIVRDLAWRIQFGSLYSVCFSLSVPLLMQRAMNMGYSITPDQCDLIIESLRDRKRQADLVVHLAARAIDFKNERFRDQDVFLNVTSFDETQIDFTPDMVLIDVTKPLSFQDLGEELVLIHGQEVNDDFVATAGDLLALEPRRVAYRRSLWRGYVITHPEYRSYVRDAVVEYVDELLASLRVQAH